MIDHEMLLLAGAVISAFIVGLAMDVRLKMPQQPTGFLHDSLSQLAIADADWKAKEDAAAQAAKEAAEAKTKREQLRSDHLTQFEAAYPISK